MEIRIFELGNTSPSPPLSKDTLILVNSPHHSRLPGCHMCMKFKAREGLDVEQDFAYTSTPADVFLKMVDEKFREYFKKTSALEFSFHLKFPLN